ncbi:hypothetical protein AVEN_66915-1 [Araneus ventricosus]|uniref:Reverse transcriptase domain-containing protein n=1 Tax=Araneus ventricosus TaxID=182803 RepID=A0A4Y2SS49_ARAVE|nr:hypothetical protein AVEN_66915-1 [Araneus ventricosus]
MSCSQGSCSCPALWNLVANEILQEAWPENAAIKAFADGFVIICHADTKIKIENQIHAAIEKFINLGNKNKLKFLQANILFSTPLGFAGKERQSKENTQYFISDT